MNKSNKKITYHIVSKFPDSLISTGKNYEAYDLEDAGKQWQKDTENEGKEILVVYTQTLINSPLMRAPEIGAVELKENQVSSDN